MRLRLAALLGVAMVVSGCGATSTGSAEAVRIGVYAGHTLIDATQFAAAGIGAFDRAEKQLGVQIELVPVGNGQDLVAGMLGGSIDFGILPGSSLLAVNAQRGQVVLKEVLDTFEGGGLVFVGAKRYEASRGSDLRAYDGGTWGYSKEGSQSQIIAQLVTDRLGMGWANQKGVALGPVSAYGPALQMGRADMVVADAAGAAQAVGSGAGYVVHNTNGSDEYFDFAKACNGLSTTSAYAAAHPEIVRVVAAAEREALREIKAAPDPDAVLALMPPEFREANRSAFDVGWMLFAPAFTGTDGTVSHDCIADAVAYAKAQGITNPDVTAFDRSFVAS